MSYKEKTEYNKLVGRNTDWEIIVLDYSFTHSDELKWLTGSRFNLLTEEDFQQRKDNYDYKELRQMAVADWRTEDSLDDFKAEVEDDIDLFIDTSYSNKDYATEMIEKFSKIDWVQYEYTDCTWWGRCFGEEMLADDYREVLFFPEIKDLIQQYEWITKN
jgi:hypothetical protein